MLRIYHTLRVAAVLAGMSGLLVAADFAPPAEGPVAFRRDSVPLEPETMRELSHQLEILASGLDHHTSENRRVTAQMLALATTLDPANMSAKNLILAMQADKPLRPASPAEIEKSQKSVWQCIDWLVTPEAGEQGQALANCLLDVIAVSDPSHPHSKTIRQHGERGAWAKWIPPLSAYQPLVTEKPVRPSAGNTTSGVLSSHVVLTNAAVTVPLWHWEGKDESSRWILAPSLLVMTATKAVQNLEHQDVAPSAQPFSIEIKISPETNLSAISNSLTILLQKQYPNLPSGWEVKITSEQPQKSILSGKRQSVSGAAAVLASAAITGREPEATIIGLIDAQGFFKLPTDFWEQIRSLKEGTGRRLVVPAEAAELLPSMLAMGHPEFFFNQEVVLASNFKELTDLASKVPSAAIAAASAKFQEIRSRCGAMAVGEYVANPYIRRRLTELTQEAPYLYSAKMLAIQGAGNRPTQVSRTVIVSEIRRAIAPMVWLTKADYDSSSLLKNSSKSETLTRISESCREQLDALDRFTDKPDRDLLLHAKSMVAMIRLIERATRTRGEDYVVREAVISALTALSQAYNDEVGELAKAQGEAIVPATR